MTAEQDCERGQQIESLKQLNLQDHADLQTLILALDDPLLEVRLQAYWLLKDCDSEVAQAAIKPGLKVNPGDTIHCVHETPIAYSDDWYYIIDNDLSNFKGLVLDIFPGRGIHDWCNEEYFYWHMDDRPYIPTFTLACLSIEAAHAFANSIHDEQANSSQMTRINNISGNWDVWEQFNLREWCESHKVPFEQIIAENKSRIKSLSAPEDDQSCISQFVEEYLLRNGKRQGLGQLWRDLHGSLAFVHSVTFEEITYLKLSRDLRQYADLLTDQTLEQPFYIEGQWDENGQVICSQRIISDLQVREAKDLKIKSLQQLDPRNEADLQELITTLDNPELEFRAQAYWILKDHENAGVKSIVRDGLKLNQGEVIYSVYESALIYGDDFYYLHDKVPEFINTLIQCFHQGFEIDNKDLLAWETIYFLPQYKCSHINKQSAYQAAKLLHNYLAKQLISDEKNPLDCSLFMVSHSTSGNPDYFSLREWCGKNRVNFDESWLELSPYPPSDIWDNSWRAVDDVAKFLAQSNQDDLLGQLWLDTQGRLAFVHSTIVPKVGYLKIFQNPQEILDPTELRIFDRSMPFFPYEKIREIIKERGSELWDVEEPQNDNFRSVEFDWSNVDPDDIPF